MKKMLQNDMQRKKQTTVDSVLFTTSVQGQEVEPTKSSLAGSPTTLRIHITGPQ